jgi:ABC-type amino acid transport substrate-binding protein
VTRTIAIGLYLFLPAAVLAQAPLLPGLQRVVDRGALVVAVESRELAPMLTRDKKGRLGGFDIELAKALAEALEVKLELRPHLESPDDVVDLVARGEADIAVSFLSRTPDRAKHVLFSRPYVTQHKAVLISRTRALGLRGHCPTSGEVVELARKPGQVGVQRKTAMEERLRDADPKSKVEEFDTLDALFAAVRGGDIVMALAGEVPLRRLLRDDPAASIRLRLCEVGDRPDSIAIAVRPDAPGLLHWIDAFLEEHGIHYDAPALLEHEGAWNFGLVKDAGRF